MPSHRRRRAPSGLIERPGPGLRRDDGRLLSWTGVSGENHCMSTLPARTRRFKVGMWLLGAALLFSSAALYAQREFRVYRSFEYEAMQELPEDFDRPAEFVVGRLMYPPGRGRRFGGGDWENGGTSWAVDYPRADRTLAMILRRLTRIDVRSVEQPVNLDDGDDVYYWPFLMVGLPGSWDLTEAQAAKLRDYLLRGGFLLCDSFFGTAEWQGFVESMQRVFPDRPIVDLSDDHPLFHVVYDLREKHQIANMQALYGRGRPYRADGDTPRWRGILDDQGRLMVVIAFNNDVGDSWQWADDPDYPAEDANLGLRLGVNFAVYAMTH
jgi:hypothetical protein